MTSVWLVNVGLFALTACVLWCVAAEVGPWSGEE